MSCYLRLLCAKRPCIAICRHELSLQHQLFQECCRLFIGFGKITVVFTRSHTAQVRRYALQYGHAHAGIVRATECAMGKSVFPSVRSRHFGSISNISVSRGERFSPGRSSCPDPTTIPRGLFRSTWLPTRIVRRCALAPLASSPSLMHDKGINVLYMTILAN